MTKTKIYRTDPEAVRRGIPPWTLEWSTENMVIPGYWRFGTREEARTAAWRLRNDYTLS